MENENVRIRLEMEERLYHHKVVTEVEEDLYPDLGSDAIDALERVVNSFLNTYGYPNYNSNRVMLISMTDEEHEALADYLWDLRHEKKEKEGGDN